MSADAASAAEECVTSEHTAPEVSGQGQQPHGQYTLRQLASYTLGLGTWGFGGPVALVGYMHRDLVERRGWVSEAEFKEGLTLSQIMPGPLATQLAIYLGFLRHGSWGGAVVGVAFVLPSFLMVVALGWAYTAYGGLPWVQAAFFGVGASVIAIIAVSAYKLSKKTVGGDRLLWAIFAASAAVTAVAETEYVALFLLAGLATMIARTPPAFLRRSGRTAASLAAPLATPLAIPLAAAVIAGGDGGSQRLWQILVFFAKAGSFVFGSGLAIVPFLYSGVVKEYGWLDEQQFLDAVAVAMVTPGPVVITVGFIGYLVAGFAGAVVASVATFLPCYLLTVIPAPYFKKYGKLPWIIAFVDGVTAAAVGAIAGAVLVLGRRTLLDGSLEAAAFKVLLCCLALAVLLRFRKLPEPFVVLAAAIIGLAIFPLLGG